MNKKRETPIAIHNVDGLQKDFQPTTNKTQVVLKPTPTLTGTSNTKMKTDTSQPSTVPAVVMNSAGIIRSHIPDNGVLLDVGSNAEYLFAVPDMTAQDHSSICIGSLKSGSKCTPSKELAELTTEENKNKPLEAQSLDSYKPIQDAKNNSGLGDDYTILRLNKPENRTETSPHIALTKDGIRAIAGKGGLITSEEYTEIVSNEIHLNSPIENLWVHGNQCHASSTFVDAVNDIIGTPFLTTGTNSTKVGRVFTDISLNPARGFLQYVKEMWCQPSPKPLTALASTSSMPGLKNESLVLSTKALTTTPATVTVLIKDTAGPIPPHTHTVTIELPEHNHVIYNVYDTTAFVNEFTALVDRFLNLTSLVG